ncbi:transcriptional regulator [Idiomarina sp. MD25a]|uniref:metalloregulator ArsR/SmtB family transcription factor n=1 Tax=Idiomarina sp. MD25a TaxID=1889913 RepID=UPI0008F85F42|nr:metalloregulator ArsR/SmtB family transcription factor [Idiomarina sp. MD25a]OIN01550.1 transcriptional regulator [Idiomarina sp. MD25a]
MTPLKLFKCLADDTRLKSVLIVSTLEEACVCDLMDALELDQPKVSRHLAELRRCDIVLGERRGKWVYYQLHPELPDWAKDIITQAARNNLDYFSAAIKKLKQAKAQGASC